MLEPPAIDYALIEDCLRDAYGLTAPRAAFLSLGADVNTAVYRVESAEGVYFFKLRGGDFSPAAVLAPRFFSEQGIRQVIAPLRTRAGELWAALGAYTAVLAPFAAGQDGYSARLDARQWSEFAAALKAMHAAPVPVELARMLPREDYSPRYRLQVRELLRQGLDGPFADAVAEETAGLLLEQRAVIEELLRRADRLAQRLRSRPGEFVLCHADLHAGNLLIDPGGALFLVDWDTLTLAPRERDLMYIGAGLLGGWYSPKEEEALFYPFYGTQQGDAAAVAYYRYERIIQDIAAFSAELLQSGVGGEDRPQSLRFLRSNFQPGETIDIARRADPED